MFSQLFCCSQQDAIRIYHAVQDKDLSIEVNKLIENDEKEKMITYSEERLYIWYAYFAWVDEMAALE